MKPTAILTADWHLRDDTPVCRTDDYWMAQERKVKFVNKLSDRLGVSIFFVGDLFKKARPSYTLLSWSMDHVGAVHCIPGNHDLPDHNLKLLDSSAMGILRKADRLETYKNGVVWASNSYTIHGTSWGEKLKNDLCRPMDESVRKILFLHVLVYKGENTFPGLESYRAIDLLKEFSTYDLIVTGHNHQSFVERYEGRVLVNPGSIMRMSADQADHIPKVYLWDSETNEVEAVELPIEKGVISRQHIDIKQERDLRMDAFVQGLKDQGEISLSYEKNLENNMARTDEEIKLKVWESLVD